MLACALLCTVQRAIVRPCCHALAPVVYIPLPGCLLPCAQVRVVPCALASHPGPLRLTFYPAMPGNSTARPAEKWAAQRRHMAPGAAERAFQGAAEVECPATTLSAFVAEQQLEAIDLLKVLPFFFLSSS